MPIIEAHIIEGYEDEAKSRLCASLSNAARMVIPAAPEAVTILVHEYPHTQYMRGGQHRSGAVAATDPEQVVREFLSALERRDVPKAESFLGEGFEMVFPGTGPMHSLEELIAWAAPRYQRVGKTYIGIDAIPSVDHAIVYARGTLHGVWPDGTSFDGIRFIDRFEIRDGKILRQDVWNDIGEVRGASPEGDRR